ncbi:Serine/threonine-protein kinase PknL [Maioricimonas rarisocia]|uniref:non-specific serine/threonine protein kinase n=1 Tax=Maioricimonas rarisocia TaxID=2528026 RepID=A0A517ZFK5_9PLAN|nr:BREX system serine/threonine kinase PglW [Maioricimonas rarisocia]QDU41273.1 Serine/threonine-protein kinase PknL [Maioricimonas rarisocia]
MAEATNWTEVTKSVFAWETEALDFVRQQFPAHAPYRAWSNFEFVADDGTINEVDLLVFTPNGFLLIEIKSRPGRLRGDAGTWIWETEGKSPVTLDNPRLLANSKAKKLRGLLQRQKAFRNKGQVPWIDAIVFCSAPKLKCDLEGNAALGVVFREADARPDIMTAIRQGKWPGAREHRRDNYDRPTVRLVAQAMEQAGIRPTQRSRRVSDYVLEQLLDEGPGYQDWKASHVTLKNVRRRVRIYNVRTGATQEERDTISRAARREAELLESLQHPGILRREGYTGHELGPALIFEHDPLEVRLDHFLAGRHERLSFGQRLELLRQIAEVIQFAHEKRVVHRALSPQSILVREDGDRIDLKVFNWQVGYRDAGTSSGMTRGVTATSHVDRLVEDVATAYMAPEALIADQHAGEHLDVFSLGAIAWHFFAGQPPAADGLQLSERLRNSEGLRISSVLNGAGENLEELIRWSTHPDVGQRLESAREFLTLLELVEEEATTPDLEHLVTDPTQAKKDDLLPGNLRVIRRLGTGACSIAFLVEKEGQEFILKAANSPDQNVRLQDEADVLTKLRHNHIVEQCGTVELGDWFGFLMRPVFASKEDRRIETLRDRLQQEGRLHVDLLQRFGEDLLDVVRYLEEEAGIPHRDLKPDNIAIGQIRRGDKLHLVLFDFSLSRTSPDNIRAGTAGYLDPMLPLRKNQRWDLHAERYAAAATLYELAAGPGNLPVWGDGASDPSHLSCEATIDGDLFDTSVRDPLVRFFERAFRRDPSQRFDNADQMLAAWRDCFAHIDDERPLSDHVDEEELQLRLEAATFETPVGDLGLGPRAANALDRVNILTVADLLNYSTWRLNRLRGVGKQTREQIRKVTLELRNRLGKPPTDELTTHEPETDQSADVASLGIDALAAQITRAGSRDGQSAQQTLDALLGLDERLTILWPSQTDIATLVEVTRGRVSQLVGKFQKRWAKQAGLTRLRSDIAEILATAGGVMALDELIEALLAARGAAVDEPQRSRLAIAVARAAVEVERTMAEPRFQVRRDDARILVATSSELAAWARRLGDEADQLADEDPLVPPTRALQHLRQVDAPPEAAAIPDGRLVRLAAAASRHAALSSRQELYPRRMEAARALKLSQGALYGVRTLTIDQIRKRVAGRYPLAEPLPGRPELDQLLQVAGFDCRWDENTHKGGCYVIRSPHSLSISSGSQSDLLSRQKTASTPPEPIELTPEDAESRQLDERLDRAIRDGAYLALLVRPGLYEQAAAELCHRFPLQLVNFEALFLECLRDAATEAGARWDVVLKADANPGSPDWTNLMILIARVMPEVRKRLVRADRTILLTWPGLLARYDQMSLLDELREKIGRKDGIPGLWLLVPGSQQAIMDNKAIPLIGPGQRTRLTRYWIENRHRSQPDRSRTSDSTG